MEYTDEIVKAGNGKGQVQAVIMALRAFGGKGRLCQIQRIAVHMPGSEWPENPKQAKANIRRIVRHTPKYIVPVEGEEGCYKLRENDDCEQRIKAMEKEIERLRAQSADAFVPQLVKKSIDALTHEKDKIKALRICLYAMGREKEVAVLDSWLEGKEKAKENALERLATMIAEAIKQTPIRIDKLNDIHGNDKVEIQK